jgi:hypothetical protein
VFKCANGKNILKKAFLLLPELNNRIRGMQIAGVYKIVLLLFKVWRSVADPDPGSGAFLPPGSGMNFFRIPDPRGMFLVRFS